MTLPGGTIYEGDFEGDILKKGTITLPSGYKKIGRYNHKGLFEGTLVYTDKQGRQWQREIQEGQISAGRTQVNPPANQPHDQTIADDRRIDDSQPGNVKESIGEFTIDDEGALTGQGIVIWKREDSWWMEEGIFEDDKLIKGKTTYYRINEDNNELYPFFEFDGAYVDNLQGRRMEWGYYKKKIAIEIREGNFSLEDPDFFTILEGMGRTRSLKGNRQEGLFEKNELRQGRRIYAERIIQEKRNETLRERTISGRKEEGFFLGKELRIGQIFWLDKLNPKTYRGKWNPQWFKRTINPVALVWQEGYLQPHQKEEYNALKFNGIQFHYKDNKQYVFDYRKNRQGPTDVCYESAFIDV